VGDLPAFFAGQQQAEVGDSWTAKQLRRKSFEDLQRLWFVLLREKNMLLTYKELCRQVDAEFVNHARFKKVGDSMSRIRYVPVSMCVCVRVFKS
jgi:large subunit ribosomal protein L47